MIGHVFTSSGATTIATAPGIRPDEYVVLASYETSYVVAPVLVVDLPNPSTWLHGTYYERNDLDAALSDFAVRTGISTPVATLRAQVERIQDRLTAQVTTR